MNNLDVHLHNKSMLLYDFCQKVKMFMIKKSLSGFFYLFSSTSASTEPSSFYFEKYLNNMSEQKNFQNPARIKSALQTITFNLQRTQKIFEKFLLDEIIRFHSIATLVEVEKNFSLISKFSDDYEIRRNILSKNIQHLPREKYKNIFGFFEIIVHSIGASEFDMLDFFKKCASLK